MSGFSRSPAPARAGRATRTPPSNGAGRVEHDRAPALIVAVACRRRVRLDRQRRRRLTTWTVGTKWRSALSEFAARCYEHHADAAGLLHGEALVVRAFDAAVAEHDLAGDLGRIEQAPPLSPAEAQGEPRRVGAGQPAASSRRRAAPVRPRSPTRRAVVGRAVAERDRPLAVAVVRARSDRRDPRAGCATVDARGPGVAGRGGDEDARVGREQERDLDRVEEVRRRAADRVVDHVDAVGDGLVDRGREVEREAARRRASWSTRAPCNARCGRAAPCR